MFKIEKLEEKHWDKVFCHSVYGKSFKCMIEIVKESHRRPAGCVAINDKDEIVGALTIMDYELKEEYKDIIALADSKPAAFSVFTWTDSRYPDARLKLANVFSAMIPKDDESYYDVTPDIEDPIQNERLRKYYLTIPNTFEHEGRLFIQWGYDERNK